MGNIYFELTLIITLATFYATVFRQLKQPPIIAYILTGMLLGPLAVFDIHHKETFQSMGEIGITLLLFLLGLELKLSELKSIGEAALKAGVAQIVFTAALGFGLASVLGFSVVTSLYIAAALTFSSTIVIIKLLSDKRDLNSLYGKIAVGILLVQDFVAILALIFLAGLQDGGTVAPLDYVVVAGKAVALFGVVLYLSKKVLPVIVSKISSSPEILFLFSLSWAFGISALVSSPLIGFSIEIGGFLAGLSLANSAQNYHIVARVRPLRDFFVTIFFVLLGMGMSFTNLGEVVLPAFAFALFVLVGNPLIVMTILAVLGYRKRTSFFAGVTIAQISEFSLILIFIGERLGHFPEEIVSLITVVGIITFVASTYMIMHVNTLYSFVGKYLSFLERKHPHENLTAISLDSQSHTILIGAGGAGEAILESLKKSKEPFIVIDFDPDMVAKLENQHEVLFGDISDTEIQERARIDTAKMIISTITDIEDSARLLKRVKKINKKAKVIIFAQDKNEAKILYDEGATYVVVPHLSGGKHIAKLIREEKTHVFELLASNDRQYLFD